MFEPGPKNTIDVATYGLIRNFPNWDYLLGGLSGGVVVVAVLDTAVTVIVSDGGGLTWTLVLPIGPAGSKLIRGWMLAGLGVHCGR